MQFTLVSKANKMECWIKQLWLEERVGEFKPLYSSWPTKSIKMNLETYQETIQSTAIYPKEIGLAYTTLGLMGEFQEFCEVLGEGEHDQKKEFGDVCWYLTASCQEAGLQILDVFPADVHTLDKNFLMESSVKANANKALGRIAEIVKKYYRDGSFNAIDLNTEYHVFAMNLCLLANIYSIDIEEALQANYEKLQARKAKGMIGGSGSDREEENSK